MTAIAAWVGVDARSAASVYLASDSRISWSNGDHWDFGRKLFASRRHPELLGYCGDVEFPSLLLGQIVDLIDSDAFFTPHEDPRAKFQRIANMLRAALQTYPKQEQRTFSILYCTRAGVGMAASFHLATLSWSKGVWAHGWVSMPQRSDLLVTLGSGAAQLRSTYEAWSQAQGERTSRSVFSAFCDSLGAAKDPTVGGAPQLVGLYRKGSAEHFGVIDHGNRFLLGLPVEASPTLDAVEWRNELFERCDWRTTVRLARAQPHARPKGTKG